MPKPIVATKAKNLAACFPMIAWMSRYLQRLLAILMFNESDDGCRTLAGAYYFTHTWRVESPEEVVEKVFGSYAFIHCCCLNDPMILFLYWISWCSLGPTVCTKSCRNVASLM